jgi:hypothetical protein
VYEVLRTRPTQICLSPPRARRRRSPFDSASALSLSNLPVEREEKRQQAGAPEYIQYPCVALSVKREISRSREGTYMVLVRSLSGKKEGGGRLWSMTAADVIA